MGNLTLQQVEEALVQVREFILSDGGDIEVVEIKDHQVHIRLKGACVSCPLSMYTVQMGIVRALKEKLFTDIEVVVIED